MKTTLQFLLGAGAVSLAACAPGYTRASIVYAEPAQYEYEVPVDRVVVVTREVLIDRGWTVYRVERSGRNRIVWARRGDDDVVRIFASPNGQRVVVRGLWEARDRKGRREHGDHDEDNDRGDRGRRKGWVRRGPPQDVIAAIDIRLKNH